MKQFTLSFIRLDRLSVERSVLASFKADCSSATTAQFIFINAVAQWLKAEGKGMDVEGDFNIGDLQSYLDSDSTNEFSQYGIHNLTLKDVQTIDFDLNFMSEDIKTTE